MKAWAIVDPKGRLIKGTLHEFVPGMQCVPFNWAGRDLGYKKGEGLVERRIRLKRIGYRVVEVTVAVKKRKRKQLLQPNIKDTHFI